MIRQHRVEGTRATVRFMVIIDMFCNDWGLVTTGFNPRQSPWYCWTGPWSRLCCEFYLLVPVTSVLVVNERNVMVDLIKLQGWLTWLVISKYIKAFWYTKAKYFQILRLKSKQSLKISIITKKFITWKHADYSFFKLYKIIEFFLIY